MRRTLSSKLLHAGVDTGVRQRILGHLEGTTVDAHYSDDGLAELKEILDRVDYGLQIGHDRRFGFPVITGCARSLLPTAAIELALQENGGVGAIRILDTDTEEVLFQARVAGAKLPSTSEYASAPEAKKSDCAAKLREYQTSHEFLMPGSEEAVEAIEHLLIFAEPTPSASDDKETAHGSVDLSKPPAPAMPTSSGDVVDLAPGRIVLCDPSQASHATATNPQQPGLIVAEKHLAGRRYLDIAIGKRAATGAPRPWQLVLSSRGDLETAQLPAATWFDMRRRILIEAGDVQHLGDPLGCVESNAEFRIREHLQAAGDVYPKPLTQGGSR
ncbi:hypothetical protein U879_08705 [Defluviimonas sp. 20V17]|uniref:Uncharacterized protein n=1 Tax=Allgaiera indica TaxID=765699 RepID=A0AAN5A1I1_9RHOB|nr:hypothetical protein [Allgaiera indica]KDB04070.1 hypothetical protein U879_08705 [Defluviimonas sp. 20V17]GHE06563.1 hypothetical protein GCM10008024_41210 [Allgaiera indica]